MKKETVYLFYFEGSLYALTQDKKVAKAFRDTRCDRMVYIKKKLNVHDIRTIAKENSSKYLFMEPLTSGDKTIDLPVTPDEDAALSEALNDLDDLAYRYRRALDVSPLKEKYNEILFEAVAYFNAYEVDIVKLFIDMFEDTFVDKDKKKKVE